MKPDLAYFAAHAPDIPKWFAPLTWKERVIEPIPNPPPDRIGWVHSVEKQFTEMPMDHFVRWRIEYAKKMVQKLNDETN